jgi:hypothetical protein
MKKLYQIVLILIVAYACADRNPLTDDFDPTLGGDYTELGGSFTGTLLKSDSPFLVSTDLIIESRSTIVIEPGTELFFRPEVKLIVHGRIDAIGTQAEPIRFTVFDLNTDWGGIHLLSPADYSTFEFCIIERVYLPEGSPLGDGAVEITNGSATIKNCTFQYNYAQNGGGLALDSSNVTIKNNIFYRNRSSYLGGAILSENSVTKIINNTFYRNYSWYYGGGLVINNPVSDEIQNNIFYANDSYLGDPSDPRIYLMNGDSSNVMEQYNFLAFGTMNPQFISETNLRLAPASPCINSGNPDPLFNDADSTRNDQGAYGGPDGNW